MEMPDMREAGECRGKRTGPRDDRVRIRDIDPPLRQNFGHRVRSDERLLVFRRTAQSVRFVPPGIRNECGLDSKATQLDGQRTVFWKDRKRVDALCEEIFDLLEQEPARTLLRCLV